MNELECIRRLLEMERAKSAILTDSLDKLISVWSKDMDNPEAYPYRPKPVFQDDPAKEDSDCSLSFASVISVIALVIAFIALCLTLKHT